MRVTEFFPTKYVAALDLGSREHTVTIKCVVVETMRDGTAKPVVYFHGAEKGLVLNKTNAGTIADMFGEDSDGWAGRRITIYPTQVDYQSKRVDAIRIKFIQPPPRQLAPNRPMQPAPFTEHNPPPASEYPAGAEMNDEIPF